VFLLTSDPSIQVDDKQQEKQAKRSEWSLRFALTQNSGESDPFVGNPERFFFLLEKEGNQSFSLDYKKQSFFSIDNLAVESMNKRSTLLDRCLLSSRSCQMI